MRKIRKVILASILLPLVFIARAQTKQPKSSIPDMQQLMKMSPAELEAYKEKMLAEQSQQAKTLAREANFNLDESLLPDFEFKQPVKDLKRLSLIPTQSLSLLQLSEDLKLTKQQLEVKVSKEILLEVKQIVLLKSGEELQSSSLAFFSSNKPVQSLLLSMEAVIKNTQSVLAWNNMAGIMNMGGLQHKSIPVLQHWLVKYPQSSTLLNNMGQAYLGLGDLGKAEQYLGQCLQQDALHPEANRSMGMISLFKKDEQKAKQYFEREVQVAFRKSTMALMKKRGIKFNLYQLRKRSGKIPGKNFFEEIALGKFQVPDFPKSTGEVQASKKEHEIFLHSVTGEILFWMNASALSPDELKKEGKKYPGLYADFVEVALDDLHEVFHEDLLTLFQPADITVMEQMIERYYNRLNQSACANPPAGSSMEVVKAYQKKCCDQKNAITNAFLYEYNAFIDMKADIAVARWKDYLNALINIASLAPSSGNEIMVYQLVQGYFNLLAQISQAGQFLDPVMECAPGLPSDDEATAIIESSRNINIKCPSSLNIEINLVLAKLKADCNKFAIEAGAAGIVGAFEKEFNSGTYTFMGGVGVGGEYFFDMVAAEAKQQVYISFDNNNNFSDFGIKGSVELGVAGTPAPLGPVKTGGTLMGVEAGYTLGFNSGFNTSVEGKGFASTLINN